MDEQYLTVTEAAKQLGISAPTVRRLIDQHELTAMRAGLRKWVIPASALKEYREARFSQAKRPPVSTKSESIAPAPRRRASR